MVHVEPHAERPLRWAGVGLWLAVALPLASSLAGWGPGLPPGRVLPFFACWLSWGLVFHWPIGAGRRGGHGWILLVIQSLLAVWLVRNGIGGAEAGLLVVVAGQAPFILPARAALALVLAQTAAVTLWMDLDRALPWVLTRVAGLLTFQLFALGVARLAVREASAREEAQRLSAELISTRALLFETARGTERVRIARDLHDALGHHLTALSLNLEAASCLMADPARSHVAKAQAVARRLLADVRDVVAVLRDERDPDLASAIRTFAAGVPRPLVHLGLPDRLHVGDGARAHALLRCVQEIVTNAARHSGARNLWIEIRPAATGYEVEARDDGHGAPPAALGAGLSGMRERFEEVGGRVEIDPGPGRGFSLRAYLPVEVRA